MSERNQHVPEQASAHDELFRKVVTPEQSQDIARILDYFTPEADRLDASLAAAFPNMPAAPAVEGTILGRRNQHYHVVSVPAKEKITISQTNDGGDYQSITVKKVNFGEGIEPVEMARWTASPTRRQNTRLSRRAGNITLDQIRLGQSTPVAAAANSLDRIITEEVHGIVAADINDIITGCRESIERKIQRDQRPHLIVRLAKLVMPHGAAGGFKS